MRFREFKLNPLTEAILGEVSMTPTTLTKWAASPDAEGVLMGFEFEMIVPPFEGSDDLDDYDDVPNYDEDVNVYSIQDIIDFFEGGENPALGGRASVTFAEQLRHEYYDWLIDNFDLYLDDNWDIFIGYVRDRLRDEYDYDDAFDRAREEMGEDADEDDVEERANEIRDEDIDQIISDADSEYENAHDIVRDDMRDDYESNVRQSDWLEAIGINNAAAAERRWNDNLAWPHLTSSTGGLSAMAADFARAIGIDSNSINVSSSYHGAEREDGKWIIETDSSIKADSREGEVGLEFVSPAQPIKKTLDQMERLVGWAKTNKCRTDKSTGLHMNISFPGYSLDKLDYIKLALFMGDNYILDQFSRSTNTYCSSATSIILRQANTDAVETVFAKMREHMNVAASKIIHNGLTDKYTSINTKDGYIEFRGPGGDYLNKPLDKLGNMAIRLAMAMKIACDDTAYSQEYGKKLYKLIAADGNETTNVFAKYTSGYLTKGQMMTILRKKKQTKAGVFQVFYVSVPQPAGQPPLTFPVQAYSEKEALAKVMASYKPITSGLAPPYIATQNSTTEENIRYQVSVRGREWTVTANNPVSAQTQVRNEIFNRNIIEPMPYMDDILRAPPAAWVVTPV